MHAEYNLTDWFPIVRETPKNGYLHSLILYYCFILHEVCLVIETVNFRIFIVFVLKLISTFHDCQDIYRVDVSYITINTS